MPQETKSHGQAGGSAGAATHAEHALCGGGDCASGASLAGAKFDIAGLDAASAMEVLENAFDYRGDVTLTLRDGSTVAGYLFDRRRGATLEESVVRVMLPDAAGTKVSAAYGEIASISLSERDPAAGKSFETWVKKYVEKKLKGERASLESETLD